MLNRVQHDAVSALLLRDIAPRRVRAVPPPHREERKAVRLPVRPWMVLAYRADADAEVARGGDEGVLGAPADRAHRLVRVEIAGDRVEPDVEAGAAIHVHRIRAAELAEGDPQP